MATRARWVVVLVLAVATQVHAEPLFEDRQRIETWLAENDVPAVGIGIIRDGKVREVQVFGELKKGTPAPYDSIFNVASLAKPILTLLTMRLVTQGKWSLDEPLAKYWMDPDLGIRWATESAARPLSCRAERPWPV